MAHHLYVYYKTTPDALPAQTLRDFVAAVSREIAIQGSLQRRPAIAGGLVTWMECYIDIPGGFAELLAARWQASGLGLYLAGGRHIEEFVDA